VGQKIIYMPLYILPLKRLVGSAQRNAPYDWNPQQHPFKNFQPSIFWLYKMTHLTTAQPCTRHFITTRTNLVI
jgi:hypothetical protein